jgi:hypothetical protein
LRVAHFERKNQCNEKTQDGNTEASTTSESVKRNEPILRKRSR